MTGVITKEVESTIYKSKRVQERKNEGKRAYGRYKGGGGGGVAK